MNLDGTHALSICWCRNETPEVKLTHKEACLLSQKFNDGNPQISDGEAVRINEFLKQLIGECQ